MQGNNKPSKINPLSPLSLSSNEPKVRISHRGSTSHITCLLEYIHFVVQRWGTLTKEQTLILTKYLCRARNSCLQTRKMRAEIQFCELKIWALEKSCEFNISAKTKLLSWSHRRSSKMQWKLHLKHLRTQTCCHILCDFILFSSAQVSSANHSEVTFLLFINNYTCYLHFDLVWSD